MRIYLAGTMNWIHNTILRCKLNGDKATFLRNEKDYKVVIEQYSPYVLESFYYMDNEKERLLPFFKDFMLDSGAFTFMQRSSSQVNWDEYVEQYAEFIKRNKIEKFFELDIDSLVGYDKVCYLRDKLEKLTNRQSIPVWHKNRGKEGFIRMCETYKYVSLGGMAGKEWIPKHNILSWFISEAHKRGCMIHGLGYTSMDGLRKYHFDSVDSTSWNAGNRFGFVYKFDGKKMVQVKPKQGDKLGDVRAICLHNYIEWIKFQKYAEVKL